MATILNFCNGMLKVGYERRTWLKTCSVGIFVGAGSRNEKPEENGIAHFIEHMLFKGTEKRSAYDLAKEMDSLGANINAYTSKTNTVFYVSGLAKHVDKYMEILSDMLFNSTFKDEDIEKERGVVLEEIKMYDDDGESVASDLLNEKFFEGDTLSRPILGTPETVKSFNAEMIRDFMKRYYNPKNIFIVYVGPSTSPVIIETIKKYFESVIKERGFETVKEIPEFEKPITKPVYVTKFDKPFEQANVQIRFPAFSVADKRSESMGAVVSALGGGMSSRLFQKIREEQGLVYEIYASSTSIKGAGYVDIGFATAPELVPKAIESIREVLESTARDGFTEEEFFKVKTQREAAVVYANEGTFDEMRVMGRYYFLIPDEIITVQKMYEKFEKMTLEDMNEAFNQIFRYEEVAICYVGKPIDVNLKELMIGGGQTD